MRSAAGSRPLHREPRLSRADLPWLSAYNAALIGPIDTPSRARLIRAIERLNGAFPESRIGWRPDARGQRWITTPRTNQFAEMVVDESDDPSADLGGFLEHLAERSDLVEPTAFIRMPRHLAVRMSHAVGDGRVVTQYLSGALTAAATGALPNWPTTQETRWPYRRALMSFAREHPGTLLRTLTSVRPGALPSDKSNQTWHRQRAVVCRRLSPDGFAAVRAWRKHGAPGVSTPALEMALVVRAAAAAGLELEPEVLTLYDCRRYLPAGNVSGNFVVGVLVPIQPATALADVGRLVQEAADAGRPLTALGNALLRARRTRKQPGAPRVARARLAFSHIGRPTAVERLPWTPGAIPTYTGTVEPAGPCGVTVVVTETGRAMHLSASFHSNVIPRDLVEATLDAVCADPIGLLARSGEHALPASPPPLTIRKVS